MPSPQEILAELKKVKYPGFSRDIVSFGMIKDIEVSNDTVTVILSTSSTKPEALAQVSSDVQRTRGRDGGCACRQGRDRSGAAATDGRARRGQAQDPGSQAHRRRRQRQRRRGQIDGCGESVARTGGAWDGASD